MVAGVNQSVESANLIFICDSKNPISGRGHIYVTVTPLVAHAPPELNYILLSF